MRLIIFSGSHSRHLYVHKKIVKLGFDYLAIVMQRENLIPESPENIEKKDRDNFKRHFEERLSVEKKIYSDLKVDDVFDKDKALMISPKDLNSEQVCKKVIEFKPDIAFIFGCDLIKEPLISMLPKYKINLHLGLSPWYRGSATLFWPFYFLEPQFAGITLHNISLIPDSGEIFHQTVPDLEIGDSIHDVAAKAVVKASDYVVEMMSLFEREKGLTLVSQKSTGRVWRDRDFKPYHLRLIYDLFNNNIVDEYLNGNLGSHKPKLINGFKT
tara:strand:+ start:54 stop:863 length:810 start_codon:yes stop_codon:yes gene_type:complete